MIQLRSRIRSGRTAAAALGFFLGGGCSLDDRRPVGGGAVGVDSAGVRIVESREPVWHESPRVVGSEPLVDVGSEEEGPEQFGAVSGGLLLQDGGFLVSDLMAREVRVFGASGEHRATLGGPGEGPGEFGGPVLPFGYLGDSVAVFDQRLRRTTVFSIADGGFRTIRNQMDGNYVVFGTTGAGALLYMNPGRGYRPDLEPGLQWDTTNVYLAQPDGSATVISRRASRQQLVLADGNTDVVVPAQGSVRGGTEEGFFWATTDRYEIHFYGVGGELRRIVRRPVTPTRVTDDMIEAYIEAALVNVRRFEGETAVPRYRRRYEEGRHGDWVPLFTHAFVDQDQRLWVSEGTWPDQSRAPRRWTLFSPDGVWLGDVDAPDRLLILDSRGDLVLGVWTDDFDVPHVRVHRLLQ